MIFIPLCSKRIYTSECIIVCTEIQTLYVDTLDTYIYYIRTPCLQNSEKKKIINVILLNKYTNDGQTNSIKKFQF